MRHIWAKNLASTSASPVTLLPEPVQIAAATGLDASLVLGAVAPHLGAPRRRRTRRRAVPRQITARPAPPRADAALPARALVQLDRLDHQRVRPRELDRVHGACDDTADFGRRCCGVLAARRWYSGPSLFPGTPIRVGSRATLGQQARQHGDQAVHARSKRGRFEGSFPRRTCARQDEAAQGTRRHRVGHARLRDRMLARRSPRRTGRGDAAPYRANALAQAITSPSGFALNVNQNSRPACLRRRTRPARSRMSTCFQVELRETREISTRSASTAGRSRSRSSIALRVGCVRASRTRSSLDAGFGPRATVPEPRRSADAVFATRSKIKSLATSTP
jgi:hypothetical protein